MEILRIFKKWKVFFLSLKYSVGWWVLDLSLVDSTIDGSLFFLRLFI